MRAPIVVEAGTECYVKAVFRATPEAITAASTAVTFTLSAPDGTLTTVSSPNAAITGPTAGSETVDGVALTTTTWVYKTAALAQSGAYTVEAQSTAGILAASRSRIVVPSFAPFLTP